MIGTIEAIKVYIDYQEKIYPSFVSIVQMGESENKGIKKLLASITNNDIVHRCENLKKALNAHWRRLYSNEKEWQRVQLSGVALSNEKDQPTVNRVVNLFLYTNYVVESYIENCDGHGHKPMVVEIAQGIVENMDVLDKAIEQVYNKRKMGLL